jgi:hypothetical protein
MFIKRQHIVASAVKIVGLIVVLIAAAQWPSLVPAATPTPEPAELSHPAPAMHTSSQMEDMPQPGKSPAANAVPMIPPDATGSPAASWENELLGLLHFINMED